MPALKFHNILLALSLLGLTACCALAVAPNLTGPLWTAARVIYAAAEQVSGLLSGVVSVATFVLALRKGEVK